jgi:ribonuclease HI
MFDFEFPKMTEQFSPLIEESILDDLKTKHQKATEEPLSLGVVFYTDGGGQIGQVYIGGYGYHGFVHANTPTKTGPGCNGYNVTDKGYMVKSLPEGAKVEVTVDPRLTNVEPYKTASSPRMPVVYLNGRGSLLDATNNVAEAEAFNKAVEAIVKLNSQVKLNSVHLRIDSRYVIGAVKNRFKYRESDWRRADGQPLANREMWIEILDNLDKALEVVDCPWSIEWVKGHSEYLGNHVADRLATSGLNAGMNDYFFDELVVRPAQGYWSNAGVDVGMHYFMADQKWYTYINDEAPKTSDGKFIFFMGTHEEDERVGQLISDQTQSVAFISNPPKTLEAVRNIGATIDPITTTLQTNGIWCGHLNNLMSADVAELVNNHGGKLLSLNGYGKTITSHGKELLYRLTGRLENAAMVRYHYLSDLLETVQAGSLDDRMVLNDVTDYFLKTTEGKKKSETKLIASADASIKLPLKVNVKNPVDSMYSEITIDVTLTYGITLPRRRIIGGVKDQKPKVWVLTVFEPFVGFRVYTIVQLENGDIGLWTNVASNLVPLNVHTVVSK